MVHCAADDLGLERKLFSAEKGEFRSCCYRFGHEPYVGGCSFGWISPMDVHPHGEVLHHERAGDEELGSEFCNAITTGGASGQVLNDDGATEREQTTHEASEDRGHVTCPVRTAVTTLSPTCVHWS